MKITKVLSNLITEDARFQVLYKKYVLPSGDRKKGILPFEVVRDIIFADPTTRPVDYDVDTATVEDMNSDQVKVGKYTQWMLKIFIKPHLTTEDGEAIEVGSEEYKREAVEYRRQFLEDLREIKSVLAKYDRFKGSLEDDSKKNIDNVKSFEELYQLPVKVGDSTVGLGQYDGKKFKKAEGKELNNQYDIPGAEILKVGTDYTLIRIADKGTLGSKAAAYFGGTSNGEVSNGETNWCTRVEGKWSHDYRQQGPLYIMIANDGSKGVGQITGLPSDRYQIHFPTNQFKNQDQIGPNGNIPVVEWLNGKWSEFKEIFKPEFSKGFVKPDSNDVIIKYEGARSGGLSKFVALYGFDELFESLPTTITKLTVANQSDENIIINIPESINKFKSLKGMMFKNFINKVPDSICDLKELRILAFPDNPELKSLPDCIGNIKTLNFISLKGCGDVKVPESLKPYYEPEGNSYHIPTEGDEEEF